MGCSPRRGTGRAWNCGGGLDSIETFRLNGKKIPPEIRTAYKTIGGTPHLDNNYTVFGEVVNGIETIDKIASAKTSTGPDRDRPLVDIKIINAKLVKRKKKKKAPRKEMPF